MMPAETSHPSRSDTQACANCSTPFIIEPEDFLFYDRLKVPPPTWCPECRMKRRMVFRNENLLFRRTCDLCGKDIITLYHPDADVVVYCNACWWSDKWDAVDYGKEYDFTQPFFTQMQRLLKEVPRMALEALQNENSPYTNYTWLSKNIYLSPSTMHSENIMYSSGMTHCEDSIDCLYLDNSQLCYEVSDSDRCSKSRYLDNCRECIDSAFLYDCRGCTSCFMSSGLRNKSFVFRNRQLTKEEYVTAMKDVNLGSYAVMQARIDEFNEVRVRAIHRFADLFKAVNSTGNSLINVKNVRHSFTGFDSENVSNAIRFFEIKDSADLFGAGTKGELLYDGVNVGYNDSFIRFSINTYEEIRNATYCDYCRTSQDIWGCVGLRKKQYCILNKQYSKEEYEALIPKVIAHMNAMPYRDAKGRIYPFGEYFPAEMSPFAYNETAAAEYFPLSEQTAKEQSFAWRTPGNRDYRITIPAESIPDAIDAIPDSIIQETIGCLHGGTCNDACTTAFRITNEELQFYRQMRVPLPRLCPHCRHMGKAQYRNPLNVRLWYRACMCTFDGAAHGHTNGHCSNEFETPYAPDRPEIVYCEQCYNSEIA